MKRRSLAIIAVATALVAALGELCGINLPTVSWFFETSRRIPWLRWGPSSDEAWPWFGWLLVALLLIGGSIVLWQELCSGARLRNPMAERRWQRFRSIQRGHISLHILLGLACLSALDQALVGNKALAVQTPDGWVFPAFERELRYGKDFGLQGELAAAPVDYRKLKSLCTNSPRETTALRVVMPLVPYAPTGDTLPPQSRAMVQRENVFYEHGSRQPYFGLAANYHDVEESRIHIRYTLRQGVFNGPADGWDESGQRVYAAEYQDGKKISETYSGKGKLADFLNLPSSPLRAVKYHPAPPMPEEGHLLGTTSQGNDVLAYLYGGLQVNFQAALVYVPIVYAIGITLGLLMGYLGDWFDLLVQRLIEIFSNIPFLFVVIILSSFVPETFKGLPIILTILILFGWMDLTYLMRTAAYRNKTRDYIAAARVLGASNLRVILCHLLPNSVALLVTIVPFTISGLIFALAALDYLGFGLPPQYATWGRLLNDGLSNLSAPWLVSSAFIALVTTLVLITFVGEALREALDPKKHSYYK